MNDTKINRWRVEENDWQSILSYGVFKKEDVDKIKVMKSLAKQMTV